MQKLMPFIEDNFILVAGFILTVALLIINELRGYAKGVRPLSPAQLVTAINREKTSLIDVRDENSFATGHIIHSKNYPKQTLANHLTKLEEFKHCRVVLICAMGQQAASSAVLLKKHGFTNINFLQGGITAWRNAGLPLAKD